MSCKEKCGGKIWSAKPGRTKQPVKSKGEFWTVPNPMGTPNRGNPGKAASGEKKHGSRSH